MVIVCRHASGLCNVLGITNCTKDECKCRPEYFGDRCQNCSMGTYVVKTNDHGDYHRTLDEHGYGMECKCKDQLDVSWK